MRVNGEIGEMKENKEALKKRRRGCFVSVFFHFVFL
jgi:hypothetical protein